MPVCAILFVVYYSCLIHIHFSLFFKIHPTLQSVAGPVLDAVLAPLYLQFLIIWFPNFVFGNILTELLPYQVSAKEGMGDSSFANFPNTRCVYSIFVI